MSHESSWQNFRENDESSIFTRSSHQLFFDDLFREFVDLWVSNIFRSRNVTLVPTRELFGAVVLANRWLSKFVFFAKLKQNLFINIRVAINSKKKKMWIYNILLKTFETPDRWTFYAKQSFYKRVRHCAISWLTVQSHNSIADGVLPPHYHVATTARFLILLDTVGSSKVSFFITSQR